MNRLLAIFLASLLLPSSAIAQAAPALRPVDCRFLCLPGTPKPPPLVNPGDARHEVKVDVPINVLSPVIRCFADRGTIRFLAADDRRPLATASIPAGVNAAVLVFLPDPAATEGSPPAWRVLVIEDSPAKFPDAGAHVANLFGGEIRFVIGEHRNLLPRGGSHGIRRPQQRDPFNMAPVIVQFQDGETWRTASESTLRFTPGSRFLILAYVDPASGRPRVATFPDIRPARDPEES
jgi:hypothetical protein